MMVVVVVMGVVEALAIGSVGAGPAGVLVHLETELLQRILQEPGDPCAAGFRLRLEAYRVVDVRTKPRRRCRC